VYTSDASVIIKCDSITLKMQNYEQLFCEHPSDEPLITQSKLQLRPCLGDVLDYQAGVHPWCQYFYALLPVEVKIFFYNHCDQDVFIRDVATWYTYHEKES